VAPQKHLDQFVQINKYLHIALLVALNINKYNVNVRAPILHFGNFSATLGLWKIVTVYLCVLFSISYWPVGLPIA
jgi:hypothetical protein